LAESTVAPSFWRVIGLASRATLEESLAVPHTGGPVDRVPVFFASARRVRGPPQQIFDFDQTLDDDLFDIDVDA
jgi:hypothetical protein